MNPVVKAGPFSATSNRLELGNLRAMRETIDWTAMVDQGVPSPDLLWLAELVAQARWAYANRDYRGAARLYRQAVAVEQSIPYMEPPYC